MIATQTSPDSRPAPDSDRARQRLFGSLSKAAAAHRLRGTTLPQSADEQADELAAIRELITARYCSAHPVLSIIIRAHNEERELLPTLASYAFAELPEVGVELIVVDNASTDRTGELAALAGAKRVDCPRKGIGYATKAGYEACAPSSQIVFITDADVRLCRPFSSVEDMCPPTALSTAYSYLQAHPRVMGVSTGMLYEASHWSYRLLRRSRNLLRYRTSVSYWTGPNQFFRREAIDGAGGINERVEYGYGEDFCRVYSVARYCKPRQLELHNGSHVPALVDPVYQSGRRFRSLRLTLQNLVYSYRRRAPELASDGWPVFKELQPVVKQEVR